MEILKKLKGLKKLKKKEDKERHHYETLAPTDNSDSTETINMLSDFLENEESINIALSGKYGAGKTSIVKTLLKQNKKRKYKPIWISLGMLGIDKSNTSIKENQKSFCQEIEKSIIQQIIYNAKPQDLPDSNIKRINKIPKRDVVLTGVVILIVIIIYLISIYNINIGESIKYIISNIIEKNKAGIVLDVLIITIFFVLVTIILSKLVRKLIIKSYKIKLPNTEIEINENQDQSLINKYMDELVYFFSKTDYNVIVIEDLDRFLEYKDIKDRILIIFQKLKELSKILNEAKQINRKIHFIYVVKDDLYSNSVERTKFFDAIVPVIPVVSNFNSYAELKKRFETEGISNKELQDISAYISDFRLIKNITNEYFLYKNELIKDEKENGILNEKLFSMITLKNLKPRKYEELQDDKSEIYKLIKNKEALYSELKRSKEEEIENNILKIKELQKEQIESIQELKRIAIGGLYGKMVEFQN